MKLFQFIFLTLIFLKVNSFAQSLELGAEPTDKPNIAVKTFRGDDNITNIQLQTLTSNFQSELINTDVFDVLDRNQMATILQEQGFNESGACDGTACMVQMGQLLGVEKLIVGRIVRFGTVYTLSIDFIDIKTAKIEKTFLHKTEGDLVDVLEVTCPKSARAVSNYFKQKNQPTRIEDTLGTQEQLAENLEKAPLVKNTSNPNSGEWTTQKIVMVSVGSLLTLGGGTMAYIWNGEASDAHDLYNDPTETNPQVIENRWQRVETKTFNRNMAFLGTGLAALGTASIVIWF